MWRTRELLQLLQSVTMQRPISLHGDIEDDPLVYPVKTDDSVSDMIAIRNDGVGKWAVSLRSRPTEVDGWAGRPLRANAGSDKRLEDGRRDETTDAA